ncbi:unnamed protein product [Alternaria sp. RS040]
MYDYDLNTDTPAARLPGGLEPPTLVLPNEVLKSNAMHAPSSNIVTIREVGDTVQRHDNAEDAENEPLTLNEELREAGVKGLQKDYFWSEASLKRIITEERVIALLSGCPYAASDRQLSPKTILKSYLKVFAILTMLEKHDDIYECMQQGVSDETLPLEQMDHGKRSILLKGNVLSCFNNRHWSYANRDGFISYQYQVNPVLLGRDRDSASHRDFDESTILPITKDTFIERAGYGAVSKIKTTECFALKRLLPRRDGDVSKQALGFEKEVEALQRLNGSPNEHIVTLLMTWTVKDSITDRYCLLFPWAEGDLLSYWEREPYPCRGTQLDVRAIQWIAKQIVGMASALKTIHSPAHKRNLEPKQKYGRHGDIKPENILWYPSPVQSQRGTLVIADLGLTEFKSTQSRSNVPGEGLPTTPGYRPPECDLKGGKISRAFDIWTYGCLLLEMVCWMLGGQKLLNQFEDHRTTPGINTTKSEIFFDILSKDLTASQDRLRPPAASESVYYEHAVTVKKEVHEWIARIHADRSCTRFIHDLLDLIEEKMLVVIAPDSERIGSSELYAELDKMYTRVCNPTDNYCQRPCPEEKRVAKDSVPVDACLSEQALGLVRRTNPRLKSVTGETRLSKTPDQFRAMN